MKDLRKGDHYVEYIMASRKVDELQRMLMTSTMIDPSIDTAQASMALSQALQLRNEARDRYNDMVKLMRYHIDHAKDMAFEGDVHKTLYHIACLLEHAFNTEPLIDEDNLPLKVEDLNS